MRHTWVTHEAHMRHTWKISIVSLMKLEKTYIYTNWNSKFKICLEYSYSYPILHSLQALIGACWLPLLACWLSCWFVGVCLLACRSFLLACRDSCWLVGFSCWLVGFCEGKIHQNESLKGRFNEFNFMSACFLLPLKVERSKPCRHVDWLCFCFCFAFASPFAAHMILTFQLWAGEPWWLRGQTSRETSIQLWQ